MGKFNAGQKLNAAFTLGSILVLFGTGAIMFFSSAFPDDIRTGATFVHDWLARNGFRPRRYALVEDRINVSATIAGSGGGYSLSEHVQRYYRTTQV